MMTHARKLRPLSAIAAVVIAALVYLAPAARADINVTPGSGAVIFDFTCFTTKHCPAATLINSAGTEIGTTANPVVVGPIVVAATTTQAKLTVSVTNTYQQALASSATRKGCLIQNNGSNTGFVFFGAAPADTTTSFKLAPGQPISCSVGGLAVATDAVQITGTSGDVFVISSQ